MSRLLSGELADLLAAAACVPPSQEACEALADGLMGLGYGAHAARWRSWALIPPPPAQIRESIAHLRQLLFVDPGTTTESLPAASFSPAEPNTTEDPELVARQAQYLLEQGDLDGARRTLRGLARREGLPPALCNQVGMLEERAGAFWEAELWYRTSLQQIPSQHMVWFPLAKVLLLQAAWDEALAAAEQGLRLSPSHPWGLKLRFQALRATGAVATLSLLASRDGLPEGEDHQGFMAAHQARRRRREAMTGTPPAGLSMLDRLRLKSLLSSCPSPWVILQARSAAVLLLLHREGLLPENLQIQPIASRDPIGVTTALTALPIQLLAEEPISVLPSLPRIGLLVTYRSPRSPLPLGLRSLLQQRIPVLTPEGWIQPGRSHQRVLRHCGWGLWWPDSDRA